MSKYYLVASYYNLTTRNYESEIIVDLPNVDLSTIQAIDSFTASHDRSEILTLIEKTTQIHNLNHLSIKYYKSKNSDPIYYKTIENNLLFLKCIKNLKETEYNIRNKKIKALTIKSNDETKLFSLEKSKLLSIIKSKNIEEFNKIYPYNNLFANLVAGYMTSCYDNEIAKEHDLNLILTEFSRYKTFRGWITLQEKQKNKYKYNNTSYNKKQPSPKTTKDIVRKSIEENEDIYASEFEKKHGISYQNYQTMTHNTTYLDDDKEEFIEPDELDMMYNDSNLEKTKKYKK